jgi:hypothetical protein
MRRAMCDVQLCLVMRPAISASLLMRSVAAAPAAEFAQLDPVRAIAPGLVGLVVAALAVFACKRHRDAHLSASHFSLGPPLQKNVPDAGRAGTRRRIARRLAPASAVSGLKMRKRPFRSAHRTMSPIGLSAWTGCRSSASLHSERQSGAVVRLSPLRRRATYTLTT